MIFHLKKIIKDRNFFRRIQNELMILKVHDRVLMSMVTNSRSHTMGPLSHNLFTTL
jgi:hypothetical protein